MPSFDTPVRDILSGDGTQVFTPMTEAMDANAFRKVRFRLWGAAQAPASIEVYVAVQFSDNGVDWEFGSNPPVSLGYSGTLLTETWNWTSFDTWKDVFGVSGTKRLFVRFGLLAKSASASRPGSAQAQLRVESELVPGGTLASESKLVASNDDKDPSLGVFWPLTRWVRTLECVSVRRALEVIAVTGTNVEVATAFQYGNNLKDPGSWGTPQRLTSGAYHVGETIVYPEQYYNVSGGSMPDDAEHVRFGVFVRRNNSGGRGAAIVRLRVDYRDE